MIDEKILDELYKDFHNKEYLKYHSCPDKSVYEECVEHFVKSREFYKIVSLVISEVHNKIKEKDKIKVA